MHTFTGSIEIQMLCWSAVLGLLQLVIATTLSVKDIGLPYAVGPRDVPAPWASLENNRSLRRVSGPATCEADSPRAPGSC